MIFKIVSHKADGKGNFPIDNTFWRECKKVLHREFLQGGTGRPYMEFSVDGELFNFAINCDDRIEDIYIENDSGKTIERYSTNRK